MCYIDGKNPNVKKTYVQGLLEKNPARFSLDVKVVEVVSLKRSRQAVVYGAVVVSILVTGRHPQYVDTEIGVLLHILDVFLHKMVVKWCVSREQCCHQPVCQIGVGCR